MGGFARCPRDLLVYLGVNVYFWNSKISFCSWKLISPTIKNRWYPAPVSISCLVKYNCINRSRNAMSTGRNEESHGDVCIVKTISNCIWKEEAQANLYHELFTSIEISISRICHRFHFKKKHGFLVDFMED